MMTLDISNHRKIMQGESVEERFWAKVDKSAGEDGCWIWLGNKNAYGYGRFRLHGRKYSPTHRISWELNYPAEELPEFLDHRCHNRLCVNIRHLRPTTKKQNAENRSVFRSNSGVRGVTWNKNAGKWAAYVVHNRKTLYLGVFDDLEVAGQVAKNKRLELFTHNDSDRGLTVG